MQGVSVTLYAVEEDEEAGTTATGMSIRLRKLSSAIGKAETDENGGFNFHLENELRQKFLLTVSKEGYVEQSRVIDAPYRTLKAYFTLRGVSEVGESLDISFYEVNEEGNAEVFYFGEKGVMSCMISSKCQDS